MTLHEAIEKILKENDSKMTSVEIATKLNDKNLYQRKDGEIIPDFQISLRVMNYPNIFLEVDDKISLVTWSQNESSKS